MTSDKNQRVAYFALAFAFAFDPPFRGPLSLLGKKRSEKLPGGTKFAPNYSQKLATEDSLDRSIFAVPRIVPHHAHQQYIGLLLETILIYPKMLAPWVLVPKTMNMWITTGYN